MDPGVDWAGGWWSGARRWTGARPGGFVGCHNRLCDIHHIRTWEEGGPTDVDNGCAQCRRHRMLHR